MRRRNTRQRSLVAQALRGARGAVSAQELHERLRRSRQHVGLATVYRALESLVADAEATRLEREGHVSTYVACAPRHHHHLVCTTCQRVEDVSDDVVRSAIGAVRRRHGFEVDHGALDLYGVCARCRR